MKANLTSVSALSDQADTLLRSYISWIRGAAREAFDSQGATMHHILNERVSAESYVRAAREIMADEGYASLPAAMREDIEGIADELSALDAAITAFDDPDVAWQSVDPKDKARVVRLARPSEALKAQLRDIATLRNRRPKP